MSNRGEQTIIQDEHDSEFKVKKVTPFLDNGAGGLVRASADADGNQNVNVVGGNVTLEATDIEIGAVELKDGTTDARAPVSATDGLTVNLGTNNDVTVTGSVTANAGTDLNTSALALEAGGNLATIAGKDFSTETTLAAINAKLVTGTDIGDVTINNGAGVSAVNIQDGGNTITVDGTVTAELSATDNAVLDDIAANQTDKSQFTKITDGTDTALVTTAGELNVIATAQPGVDIGDVTINNATIAVTQSGTWDEVGINDSGNVITTDGSGSAGTPAGGVLTIQGVTSMTPIQIGDNSSTISIDDGGGSITVDGTISSNLNALGSVGSGKTTVTTAGTRVALGSSTTTASVTIKALISNTGLIYVGNNTVASTNGFQLSPGDTVSIDTDNLTDINIDSAVNGEGVTYIYAV